MSVNGRLEDLLVFLAFDESQIEIRMLAELSNDPKLIAIFRSGQDPHCLVGHDLTGWSVERIKNEKNLRRMVKELHFGIVFGLRRENVYPSTVARIREIDGEKADLTGITPRRMEQMHDRYFQVYTGAAAYIGQQRALAENQNYVETLFGFRRDIRKDDPNRKTFWANQAINTPIQGTAHQFILIALALLHLKPRTYSLLQRPIMEVHDALYWLVRLRDLAESYKQAKHLMERGVIEYAERNWRLKLKVPLAAEGTAGFCKGSMVDYEGGSVEEFLEAWRTQQHKIETTDWEKELMPQYN